MWSGEGENCQGCVLALRLVEIGDVTIQFRHSIIIWSLKIYTGSSFIILVTVFQLSIVIIMSLSPQSPRGLNRQLASAWSEHLSTELDSIVSAARSRLR